MSLIIVMDMYTVQPPAQRRASGERKGKLGAQNIKGGPLAASSPQANLRVSV